MIALIREEQFGRMVTALGRPELAADPRFANFAARAANAPPIFAALRALIGEETTALVPGKTARRRHPGRPDQRL